MLNKDNVRELAYVVSIDAIEPIVGSDNCEAAVVGGWKIMVRKDTFGPGDLAVYFEIDSKVDETNEAFQFLAKKHYAVKTQKYTFGGKGNFISQGLLMDPLDFGWSIVSNPDGSPVIIDDKSMERTNKDDSRFLTQKLKITYATAEDNSRKANSVDKYKKMAQRHGKLFQKPFFRWMMRRTWGKKVLFVFFGKKRDKKSSWPEWVKKTDEERCQNMPWIVNDERPWVMTEKIDGTSTTFTMKRKKFGKYDFYICSRNVVFDKPDKTCFYESNVYTEVAEKYGIEMKMYQMLMDHPNWDWVTIQGETYGAGIQRRDYGINEHNFMAFNFITSDCGRHGSTDSEKYLLEFGIPWVPIVGFTYLPKNMDDLIGLADGESVLDGKEREGIVFRTVDGKDSFKAVSNSFILKYHG